MNPRPKFLLMLLACLTLSGCRLTCEPKPPAPARRAGPQAVAPPTTGAGDWHDWPDWNCHPNAPTTRPRPADRLRVLFIGNSLTWFNGGQAAILEQLSAGEARPAICEEVTINGGTLDYHWQEGSAARRIGEGNWDVVVLQDHSSGPIFYLREMHAAARLLNGEIRRVGAATVFFQTWGLRDGAWVFDARTGEAVREDRMQMQRELADAYGTIGKELGASVAPVGWAWQAAVRDCPAIDVYDPYDGRHPAVAGSYLTGCVFYSLLYRKSPEGLTGRIVYQGEPRFELAPEVSRAMQRIAWQTVQSAGQFPATGPATVPAARTNE